MEPIKNKETEAKQEEKVDWEKILAVYKSDLEDDNFTQEAIQTAENYFEHTPLIEVLTRNSPLALLYLALKKEERRNNESNQKGIR